MKAKVLLFVLFVVALTLAVSACQPAAPKFNCTDKLGCVDIGPNDPIHIAYAFVVSGSDATLGTDTKYGVELAIDDKGGKLLGHTIKLSGQDEGCNAEGGQTAGTKIAADKTIVAVVGTNCSSAARAAMPILSQAGLSMVSPSNTAPDMTDPAKRVPGYFRTAHNDKVQGAVAAEFVAKQLKMTKAATIHDGSIYAKGLAEVFAENFKKFGGTLTAAEAVNVGDKDMKPVLTRIAAGKPELIYYPIFVAEGGFIASQIRDVPGLEKTGMMGADGIFSPDFLKAGGKNVVGMFWSSPDFEAFGGEYKPFIEKYLKKYNVKGVLAPFHAHAYDGANIIFAAIEKGTVKDADGTLHVQKQAVRDALQATKDFKGLTGKITCDANGDCADPKIAIYRASQDDFTKLTMPTKGVWSPGGANYKP
ncbi:MAG: branched-chain amino acid ABC transporter substrate-binding protein [Anaerolineales bacterium]|nr:branched-chain amino acid ABC transporter substrate-binding protein [Anaerolineales bacterium]